MLGTRPMVAAGGSLSGGVGGGRSPGCSRAPREEPLAVQVFVVPLSGKTVTLDIALSDTVDDLRWKLYHKTLVSWTPKLQFLLNGKVLTSVRDVQKGSTLRVIGRLLGGGSHAKGRRAKLVKEAFEKIDTNANGRLCFDEFLALLRRGNPQFQEDQAMALFHIVDRDLSGEVDFSEFVDYVYSNKRFEALVLASTPQDYSEQQAKAIVLSKSLRLRAAASAAVKARGGDWRKLSWSERMEEVFEQERTAPESMLNSPASPSSPAVPSSPVQPLTVTEEGGTASVHIKDAWQAIADSSVHPSQRTSPVAQAVPDGLAPEQPEQEEREAEGEQQQGPARSASQERRSGNGEASISLFSLASGASSSGATPMVAARRNTVIADMNQKEIVDYSLMREDLAFAGERKSVLKEMTTFKEHLKTAGDPFETVEVTKYLAKGTAGWVFLAERKPSGDPVALKLIRMTQVRTGIKEWYVSKLMRKAGVENIVFTDDEVHVLPRSEAPPIIEQELTNAGPVPYYVCFVQEFMNGGSLEGLAEDGKLTPEMMLKAMEDVASTLALMHSHMVQHRDVKPENVLVSMDGGTIAAAKLCDFGSAEIGDSPKGRADDRRRFGVTLFSLATGEGWTKNRLIHASHADLVMRLTEAVEGCEQPAMQGLPKALEQILDGDLEMEQVVPLIKELREAC